MVSGSQAGLSVMFDAEQYEYSRGLSEAGGFLVNIHDQNDARRLVESDAIAVDFGTEAKIGMTRADVSNHEMLNAMTRLTNIIRQPTDRLTCMQYTQYIHTMSYKVQ